MLEIKYQKDMSHNYLIIKGPKTQKSEGFQLRMMTENEIPGLLSAERRHINGEDFIYYEINSMQSLKTIFERRKIDKKAALLLLGCLRRVLRELRNYLLSEDGLILDPEYVFIDWEKEVVRFVYYPYESETEAGQFKLLMDYLVRVMDHRDEQLIDAIYGLCQLAERNTVLTADLERHLAQISHAPTQTTQWMEPDDGGMEINYATSVEKETPAMPHAPYGVEGEKKDDGKRKQKTRVLIMCLVSAGGAICCFLYQLLFRLSAGERLLSYILLTVFILFFLMMGVIYLLLTLRMARKDEGAAISTEPSFSTAEEEYRETPIAAMPDEDFGDTVFLANTPEEGENKLYGLNKAGKHIIDLSSFPFTIGKLAENTDFCLKDASISRIHAQFSQKGGAVYMTDLNSTNGTFKNGIRLEPSETVALALGDEIRLGRLEFCYR